MGYFSAIICAIGVVQCLIRRKLDSPLFLYSIEWLILSLLPAMKLYGLYEIDTSTWMIVLVGYLSYLIGIRTGNKYTFNVNGKMVSIVTKQNSFGYKVFSQRTYIFVVVILYFINLVYFFQTLLLMHNGIAMADIRAASYGYGDIQGYHIIGMSSGGILTYIYIFKEALTHIIIAVGIYRFLSDAKQGKKYLFVSIGLVILIAFSNGSRFDIVYVMSQLVIGVNLFGRRIVLQKKIRKYVRILLVAGLVGIVFISLKRGVNNIFETFYYYLASPIALLNIDLPLVVEKGIYSFPYAAFSGFFALVWPVFNKIGIYYTPRYLLSLNESVNATQAWVQIGDTLWSNAFVTPYYYLFSDARWIGVIVGMIILGYFSQRIYLSAKKNLNEINTVYYLLVIEMLFRTLYQYPFTSAVNVMEIFLLIFVTRIKCFKGANRWIEKS